MRLNWKHLPPQLRRTAANIAVMRMGILGFLALVVLSLSQSIAQLAPAEFLSSILTVNSVFAVLFLLASPLLLCWWSMRTAPRFVDAYAAMMPENAEDIREMFMERGLADMIAPWIMTRPGRLRALFGRVAGRFSPNP